MADNLHSNYNFLFFVSTKTVFHCEQENNVFDAHER